MDDKQILLLPNDRKADRTARDACTAVPALGSAEKGKQN